MPTEATHARPGHEIAALAVKKTEVIVAEYHACFDRGECSVPRRGGSCNGSTREQHPVNCVSWTQASDYCAWMGGRLPTQWEWEWAARGREAAYPYPWGRRKPTCDRTVMSSGGWGCGTEGTWPVGSKPAGVSKDGLVDMAGNVWEWTSSVETMCGPSGVLKGGSAFVENPRWLRANHALPSPIASQSPGDGFRCVRSP